MILMMMMMVGCLGRKTNLGMILVARCRFLVLCLAGARFPSAHRRECNDSKSLAAAKAAPPHATLTALLAPPAGPS